MKNIASAPRSIARRFLLPATFLLMLALAGALPAAPLSADDQQFLSAYLHIHDAIFSNDLTGVRKAAMMLPPGTSDRLANAGSIHSARSELARLTPRAEKLAAGQPECHVFYCPMAKLDWVQTNTAVENPYLGTDMRSCGVEKK